jgi:subtilisin
MCLADPPQEGTTMRLTRRASLILACAAALPLVPATTFAADDTTEPAGALEDVIVELGEGAGHDIAKAFIAEALDINIDERWQYDYLEGLWLRLKPAEVLELAELPLGEGGIVNVQVAAEVDAPEPMAGVDGYTYDGPQVEPTGYQRIGALPGKYSNVDVAVIDTGVDQRHDDLNVVGGFNCTDPKHGDLRWGIDGYGHGTHVAGTIAAIDNDRFVVGPAAGARIWSFKVLGDDGSGTFASVACGVDQARRHNIEVANLSLGGGIQPSECGEWDAVHNMFCAGVDEGIVFVVSAGNSEMDSYNSVPASYREVVTVSALADYDGLPGGLAVPDSSCFPCGPDDTLAVFSNYGSVVDFIAPGVSILSTLPGNQLGRYSGTSMASPHVAGVLAAWIADNPSEARWAVQAVTAWSTDSWGNLDSWDGDHGPDHEPLVLFGAPPPSAEQVMDWNGDL